MQTAVVTIGRNIKDKPMESATWREFQRQTAWVITHHADDIYTRNAIGKGEFTHEDGTKVTEESCTWVFSIENSEASSLENFLHNLAVNFNQESIALVLGQTTFC
jgi:hypothetical protein